MPYARAEDATQAFRGRITDSLEQLQTPRDERLETRLRAQARRQGIALEPEDEARLKAITTQERFNAILQQAERLGDQMAQSLTNGLLSIIDGTHRVGEAFADMAKSMLQSIAQVTLNEGFKTLIRLGIGLAAGAITGVRVVAFPVRGASAGGGAGGYQRF